MKQTLAAGMAGALAAVLGVAGLGFLGQLHTPAHRQVDAAIASGETADSAGLPAESAAAVLPAEMSRGSAVRAAGYAVILPDEDPSGPGTDGTSPSDFPELYQVSRVSTKWDSGETTYRWEYQEQDRSVGNGFPLLSRHVTLQLSDAVQGSKLQVRAEMSGSPKDGIEVDPLRATGSRDQPYQIQNLRHAGLWHLGLVDSRSSYSGILPVAVEVQSSAILKPRIRAYRTSPQARPILVNGQTAPPQVEGTTVIMSGTTPASAQAYVIQLQEFRSADQVRGVQDRGVFLSVGPPERVDVDSNGFWEYSLQDLPAGSEPQRVAVICMARDSEGWMSLSDPWVFESRESGVSNASVHQVSIESPAEVGGQIGGGTLKLRVELAHAAPSDVIEVSEAGQVIVEKVLPKNFSADTEIVDVPKLPDGQHPLLVRIRRGADYSSVSKELAVTVQSQGPYVTAVSPEDFGLAPDVNELAISFSKLTRLEQDHAQDKQNYVLISRSGAGKAEFADDARLIGDNVVVLRFNSPLPSSTYQLRINGHRQNSDSIFGDRKGAGVQKNAGITDVLGNALDANGTDPGGSGQDFVRILRRADNGPSQPGVLVLTPDDLVTSQVGINQSGEQVDYPEFMPPRELETGFNPSDKVVSRVVRLYYFRDAHRLSQIINRRAESLNMTGATTARQLADRARLRANQLRDQRQADERSAVASAGYARRAENSLNQYATGKTQQERRSETAKQTLRVRQDELNREQDPGNPSPNTARINQLIDEIAQLNATISDADAQAETFAAEFTAAKAAIETLQAREAEQREKWNASQAAEEQAAEDQFRLEVQAAGTDPDTYVKGDVDSRDPVAQVTITVIGEGLVQLRGPLKGVNIVQTMINEIDSPVGQVSIAIHTVQINGEDGGKMEQVAARMQQHLDLSRFMTTQSGQMLRQAIASVASRRLSAAGYQGYPATPVEFTPAEHYRIKTRGLSQSESALRRFQDAFFGAEFLRELREMDSEFVHGENKLLSLHPMDTTSLSNALLVLSLASNETRHEILCTFDSLLQTKLPLEEYRRLGLGRSKLSDLFCRTELLSDNSAFASLRGFFDGHVEGDHTMTAPQRDFIKLAQILKSRLIAEQELKQRIVERSLIEVRQKNQVDEQRQLKQAETTARTKLQEQRAKIKEQMLVVSKDAGLVRSEVENVRETTEAAVVSGVIDGLQVSVSQELPEKILEVFFGDPVLQGTPLEKRLLLVGVPVNTRYASCLDALDGRTVSAIDREINAFKEFVQKSLRKGDVTALYEQAAAYRKRVVEMLKLDDASELKADDASDESFRDTLNTAEGSAPLFIVPVKNDSSVELFLLVNCTRGDSRIEFFADQDQKVFAEEVEKVDAQMQKFLNTAPAVNLLPATIQNQLNETLAAIRIWRGVFIKQLSDSKKLSVFSFDEHDIPKRGTDLSGFFRWNRVQGLIREGLLQMTNSRFDTLENAANQVTWEISLANKLLLEGKHAEAGNSLRRALVDWRKAEGEYNRQLALMRQAIAQLDGVCIEGGAIELEQLDPVFTQISDALTSLLQSDLEYQYAADAVEAARAPIDHKKLLDMLIDEAEEKYIQLLEGTRAHTAVMDSYLKSLATALDDDFQQQFYAPGFRRVREEASNCGVVSLAQIQTESVLANNRGFAAVKPQATMEFNLPQRRIMIAEAMDLAKAGVSDYGALLSDPNFLALTKIYAEGSAAQTFGETATNSSVRSLLPGVGRQSPDQAIAQSITGRPQSSSQLEALVPDPAIYKFETGTGFEVRPVIQPDGQSVVFDFDYLYTTRIREPVRADEKHLGRVKRHPIHTDVHLSNYELRTISLFRVALKAERSDRGVPLLEDIPIIGALGRPMNDGESSLQQNLVLGQASIFPTLFDLMGLRFAPAVADLGIEELLEQEFINQERKKFLRQHVDTVTGSSVDRFMQIPESDRRSDLYYPQNEIRREHPNGHQGDSTLNFDSSLKEGAPEALRSGQNADTTQMSFSRAAVVPRSAAGSALIPGVPPTMSPVMPRVPESPVPVPPTLQLRLSERPSPSEEVIPTPEPSSGSRAGADPADTTRTADENADLSADATRTVRPVAYLTKRQVQSARKTFSLDRKDFQPEFRWSKSQDDDPDSGRASFRSLAPPSVPAGTSSPTPESSTQRRWNLPTWLSGSKP